MKKYYYLKRMMDIVISIVILVLLFIPMLVISIAILIESGRPIFFKQKRTGYKGEIFYLYKFRSMTINNDVYNLSNKDEITKVGKIIRRTSLDELPQIINIFKGEMSFIGPRPWIVDYYNNFTEEQKQRLDVYPGITGLAQAQGRNNVNILERINLDLKYVNNYSLITDIKVIYWTFKTVFDKSGVDNGKHGIQEDIQILKNQPRDVFQYKVEVNKEALSNEGLIKLNKNLIGSR